MEVDTNRAARALEATSTTGIDKDSYRDIPLSLLNHISRFPLPIEVLLVDEARAMMTRVTKGKPTLGLKRASVCHCDFFNQYLVPCRHMLHEALFGDQFQHQQGETENGGSGSNVGIIAVVKDPPFLSDADWVQFQNMFTKEEGMDVYRTRVFKNRDTSTTAAANGVMTRMRAEKAGRMEIQKLEIEELIKKVRTKYLDKPSGEGGEKGGGEEAAAFIDKFEPLLDSHL